MNDDLNAASDASPWQRPAVADPQADMTDLVRARQRSGARALGIVLGLFVVLIFAISIVKIRNGG